MEIRPHLLSLMFAREHLERNPASFYVPPRPLEKMIDDELRDGRKPIVSPW